jgi:PEP-CTERM motif
MSGLRILIPLLAITILLVVPAEATTSYYTGSSGETSFNTAVGGLTLLDPALTFSGTPGSTGLLNASGTGIDFLGFDDFQFPTIPETFTIPSGALTATNGVEHITINFPVAGVYAFGIHLTTTSGPGNWCIDLTPSGCAYNLLNSSPSNAQFFGFVSPTPVTAPLYIHSATLTGNPTPVLTNFEAYGEGASAVPEPRTMLLVGLGLLTLLLCRKQRAV